MVTIVGIAGGSGSGKSTLARKIAEQLGEDETLIVSQDSYYIDQSEKFTQDGGDVNFDHPGSLEFSLLASHLKALKAGLSVEIPSYDFPTHKRLAKGIPVVPRRVVLVDGTLILSQTVLLPYFDVCVFLDVDGDIRYERRLRRDTAERGRKAAGILNQWNNHVAPMHEQYVQPSKSNADIVIGNDESFDECIENIVHRYCRN